MFQEYMLKIPKKLHSELKVLAFRQGKTMMGFIIEAIQEKISRESN